MLGVIQTAIHMNLPTTQTDPNFEFYMTYTKLYLLPNGFVRH